MAKRDRAAYMVEYRRRKRKAVLPPLPAGAPSGVDAGAVVAAWAADNLLVPTGPLRGQPYVLGDWQRDWLSAALAPGVRESGLSVARKNGKSGLVAALLLAYLCGPLNASNWRGVVVSETGALAAELREAIRQTAESSGLSDRLTIKQSPPPGSIAGQDGALLSILASDKATGHAIGADLAVIDEAGLLDETGAVSGTPFYRACPGGMGGCWRFRYVGMDPCFRSWRSGREALGSIGRNSSPRTGAPLTMRRHGRRRIPDWQAVSKAVATWRTPQGGQSQFRQTPTCFERMTSISRSTRPKSQSASPPIGWRVNGETCHPGTALAWWDSTLAVAPA